MFEDSLLESGNRFRGGRKAGTTLIAWCLQLLLLGVMILIPLIYTEALPAGTLTTMLVAPPPPPPPPPPPAAAAPTRVVKIESELDNGALRTPTKIPEKVKMIKEEEPPPPSTGAGFGVVGGVGVAGGQAGGVMGGVIGGLLSSVPAPRAAAPPPPSRVRVSQGVSEGMLLNRVTPTYPALARSARISGQVVLAAIIDKNGLIANLRLVQGHPMLAPAALDAVKRWKYKPYYLNGEPVEVETVVTVNFSLSGGN